MSAAFYIASAVALAATMAVVLSRNAVHALLLLVVSLFAVAVMYYTIGAPLAAALEIIIYAGAIMVLFIFVIMMLNLGEHAVEQERRWLEPSMWIVPGVLSAILFAELVYVLFARGRLDSTQIPVPADAVGVALFGPYVLAVEIAAMLLLAALVGALHLGRREQRERGEHG